MMSSPQRLTSYERDSFVLRALEQERQLRLNRNQLGRYQPYSKQTEFHTAGATFRERLLMAGNQLGKTLAGSMEAAIHATGRYPEWWAGKRFADPTVGWGAGVTGESTRDNVQRLLLGRPGDFGTGSIPHDCLIGQTAARGVADLVDTISVKHVSGGTSLIGLKAYEKGREKWQGETLHWVWFDEEPDEEIYIEGLTRTNATDGIVWMTFTPLLGMSKVVKRFMKKDDNPDCHVTTMRIEEALHYTPEKRAQIIASYPPHVREAKANGIPMLGSGAVFPVSEDLLREEAIAIPEVWPRIVGLDIGWDHPTAGAWMAHDRDTDTVHVYDAYRVREQTPVVHAAAIKARGEWIPVSWPHDGLQHDKGSGVQIAQQYRQQGVSMLLERATFDDGSNGLEAGIALMLDRMQTGRLKVAAHLNEFWEEFRLYHRKDGLIVKEDDDILSAVRYGLMMLRCAKTKPTKKKRRESAGEGAWMG